MDNDVIDKLRSILQSGEELIVGQDGSIYNPIDLKTETYISKQKKHCMKNIPFGCGMLA